MKFLAPSVFALLTLTACNGWVKPAAVHPKEAKDSNASASIQTTSPDGATSETATSDTLPSAESAPEQNAPVVVGPPSASTESQSALSEPSEKRDAFYTQLAKVKAAWSVAGFDSMSGETFDALPETAPKTPVTLEPRIESLRNGLDSRYAKSVAANTNESSEALAKSARQNLIDDQNGVLREIDLLEIALGRIPAGEISDTLRRVETARIESIRRLMSDARYTSAIADWKPAAIPAPIVKKLPVKAPGTHPVQPRPSVIAAGGVTAPSTSKPGIVPATSAVATAATGAVKPGAVKPSAAISSSPQSSAATPSNAAAKVAAHAAATQPARADSGATAAKPAVKPAPPVAASPVKKPVDKATNAPVAAPPPAEKAADASSSTAASPTIPAKTTPTTAAADHSPPAPTATVKKPATKPAVSPTATVRPFAPLSRAELVATLKALKERSDSSELYETYGRICGDGSARETLNPLTPDEYSIFMVKCSVYVPSKVGTTKVLDANFEELKRNKQANATEESLASDARTLLLNDLNATRALAQRLSDRLANVVPSDFPDATYLAVEQRRASELVAILQDPILLETATNWRKAAAPAAAAWLAAPGMVTFGYAKMSAITKVSGESRFLLKNKDTCPDAACRSAIRERFKLSQALDGDRTQLCFGTVKRANGDYSYAICALSQMGVSACSKVALDHCTDATINSVAEIPVPTTNGRID